MIRGSHRMLAMGQQILWPDNTMARIPKLFLPRPLYPLSQVPAVPRFVTSYLKAIRVQKY